MRKRITLGSAALLLAVAGLHGCSEGVVQPEAAIQASKTVGEARLQASSELGAIARQFAAAIGSDGSIRGALQSQLARSTFREGKVDFRRLLADPSIGLGQALAAARGTSPDEVLATVSGLPELAIYFPVDEHRGWRGDRDMIVAAILGEDLGIEAFDLDGHPYPVNLEGPPPVRTLVIAPSEGAFAGRGAQGPSPALAVVGDYEGSAGLDVANSGTGYLKMTRSYQPDDHEPWALGDPEIYVHVATRDSSSSGNFSWTRCSGDAMDTPTWGAWQFDQNSTSWEGTVRIANEGDLDGKEAIFYVWEDDSNRCDGVSNLAPKSDTLDWSFGISDAVGAYITGGSVYHCHTGSIPEACIVYLYFVRTALDLAPGTVNDDIIGYATGKTCFSNLTGSERFYLRDEDANATSAYIEIDDTYLARELCAPDVSIFGDSYACTGGAEPDGDFVAQTTPSAGGLSYEWFEDGVSRGTGTTYGLYSTSEGTRSVKVKVTRSLDGAVDFLTISVPVYDSEDPPGGISCIE